MNILSLFVLVPAVMLLAFIPCRNIKQIRAVAVAGSMIELILALVLLFMFFAERGAGNTAEMLFTFDAVWFEALTIHYAIGVDGRTVLMILILSTSDGSDE